MNQAIDELRAIVMRAENKWAPTGLPRVAMVRAEACSDQVYKPTLHLVLQGNKMLSIGDEILHFEPATYFVIPVELPMIAQVASGDSERADCPYLALSLTLDATVIATLLSDLCETRPAPGAATFSVACATPELLDAWLRMMRLLDRPAEAALLAPMIEREILFRALQGSHGARLTGSAPTSPNRSASSRWRQQRA